ncbi:MAG: hypothetical protein ACXU8N_04605 [Telluria sp.]
MNADLDRKLQERLLLDRRVEGDALVLDDATLRAALVGARALTAQQRAALAASPLTLRRFRQLALERRAAAGWRGSSGMLRAAASGTLDRLATDDGYWTLHFLRSGGGWNAVVRVAPDAPFAAQLLQARAPVRVVDGTGAVVISGALDADGEVEAPWPFELEPGAHFQARGARFVVEPQ